ncbi:LacI family DNA-binding transcriptional regulator [Kineococcus sp. SYSU DK001]|uniref:LacI family DNA-binding transcriptional regulator n=1 Tax=Kineococcus sp. SYSU DK001 TaxID=3383122 RepID=UPI003D7D9661
MAATYKDIQRETGLSLATISKYFNGGSVRPDNAAAIEAARRSLGFQVNEVARSLRTRRSKTVGVLLPELNNGFHLSIIAGVEGELREAGMGVVVSSSGHQRGSEAVDFLRGRMVDAIIAVPAAHDGPALRAAGARGLPLVVVDRLLEGLDTDAVVLDNPGASQQVVSHLTDHGHRDVGFVGGPDDVWTMRERRRGFEQAMARAGLDVAPQRVRTGPLTVEFGHAATRALLAGPRPTALHCANYELTVGSLIALNEAGVTIPHDISFVGFDGPDLARAFHPRLSVLVQPVHEIAVEAARMVGRRLLDDGAGHPASRSVLPGRLERGASVTTARR